jgi:uncharacterized membrane protein
MVIAMVVVRITYRIDEAMNWSIDFDRDAARIVLVTLASSVFTFIVYVASFLLLAVQLASAQLTPRIIGIVFKDRITRFSLMFFIITFILLCGCLVRTKTMVPLVTTYISSFCCLASLIVFLFLIDHVGKSLRPSGVLLKVALRGRKIIGDVYPHRLTEHKDTIKEPDLNEDNESVHIVISKKNGVLLAFDVQGLVSLASRRDCVIVLIPQAGDFVAVEQPLFKIVGGKSIPSPAELYNCVAFGQERTPEQDPIFAFRIIVDIASKGLSPAINDPTTAVLAIDQIHRLLSSVGGRHLDEGRRRDSNGVLRFIYLTPNWEDFVYLAVTEIRHYGAESIQVVRRLRAMLENLIRTLPSERTKLLQQELGMLQRSTKRFFSEPEDQALADISDLQGVGGGNRGIADGVIKSKMEDKTIT